MLNYFENREIKLEPIGKIRELCFFGIDVPKKENQKFEFQFGGKHPLEEWRKQDNFEERLLAHCTYINQHALLIQRDEAEWKRKWRFDLASFIYLTKKDKRNLTLFK